MVNQNELHAGGAIKLSDFHSKMGLKRAQVENQDMEAVSEEINDHTTEVQTAPGSLQDPSHVEQTPEHDESMDNEEYSNEAAYVAWMASFNTSS